MLKLTHSFYRYSRITCENKVCYNSIVEQNIHLSRRGETCVTWNGTQLLDPVVPASSQSRLLSNVQKRAPTKNSYANANAIKTNKQMNNSEQPTVTNISYGAQFDISTDGASSERHSDSDNDNKHKYIPPDFRIWEPVGKKSSRREGFRFRVMSYNVLAQYLLECHPYLYTECGLQNLKWKIRAAKIYDEILSVSPDILCLQEVQVSHLSTFYSQLERLGYCGVFKQKTGARQDGCAIYYKRALFQLLDQISVEYYQPSMPILNRDNVALVVKLSPRRSPGAALVVATTHLLYNPKRTDVRLAQLQVLLAELDRLAYVGGGGRGGSDYLPIILTGDFNSSPDSAVIELLDRGHVSASALRDNSDWKQIAVTDNCQHLSVYLNRQRGAATDFSMIKLHSSERDGCDAAAAAQHAAQHAVEHAAQHAVEHAVEHAAEHAALFNGEQLAHPLRLRSVYRTVKSDGRAEATTYQDCWLTVDYIYYSGRSGLRLVERLRLPTAAECAALGRLPNERLGSDHLALAATFQLHAPDARL